LECGGSAGAATPLSGGRRALEFQFVSCVGKRRRAALAAAVQDTLAKGRARHSVRAAVVNLNDFIGKGGRLQRPAGRGLPAQPALERGGNSVGVGNDLGQVTTLLASSAALTARPDVERAGKLTQEWT